MKNIIKQKKKPYLKDKKDFKRRWITWLRMFRYGSSNFTRNIWLTTAATAVMAITLLIIFTSFIARNMLTDTVNNFRQKIDISIYLRDDVSDQEVGSLEKKLKSDNNVVTVRYINITEAREIYIKVNKPNPDELQTISELPTSPFPPSLRVTVKDPNNLASLEKLVKKDKLFVDSVNSDPRLAPSFSGDRRKVIDNLGNWITNIDKIGLAIGGIFVVISMLIVFNTIRMAIFNRRDEIEMMKLIGADKSFIRGPFVVEAALYGLVAAIVATAIGVSALIAFEPRLASYGVTSGATKHLIMTSLYLVVITMILIGVVMGVISSRMAVRRYLRV
jgi:cell division transport system permease protein